MVDGFAAVNHCDTQEPGLAPEITKVLTSSGAAPARSSVLIRRARSTSIKGPRCRHPSSLYGWARRQRGNAGSSVALVTKVDLQRVRELGGGLAESGRLPGAGAWGACVSVNRVTGGLLARQVYTFDAPFGYTLMPFTHQGNLVGSACASSVTISSRPTHGG
jgi:hypothetical protein